MSQVYIVSRMIYNVQSQIIFEQTEGSTHILQV